MKIGGGGWRKEDEVLPVRYREREREGEEVNDDSLLYVTGKQMSKCKPSRCKQKQMELSLYRVWSFLWTFYFFVFSFSP